MFEEGFYDLYDKTANKKRLTYKELTVGVAPGGYVAVWLVGRGFKTQVAGGYGEETEVSFDRFNPSGLKDRDLYVSHRLERVSPEALAKPIPFGLWETYATEYQWKPVVKGAIVDHVFFSDHMYYNGNKEIYVHQEANNIPLRSRTIPKQMDIDWESTDDAERISSEIYFDEEEIFIAFKELVTEPETQEAEIVFSFIDDENIDVFLKIDKEEKKLEKCVIKTYASSH